MEHSQDDLAHHAQCQLCGYEPKDPATEVKSWKIHTITCAPMMVGMMLVEPQIFFLACSKCKGIPLLEAFSIYQGRVKTGYDLNFH